MAEPAPSRARIHPPTAVPAGGRIIATGTPDDVAGNPASSTGRYLREHLRR